MLSLVNTASLNRGGIQRHDARRQDIVRLAQYKPFRVGNNFADGSVTISDPVPAQAATGLRSPARPSLRRTTPRPRGAEVRGTTVCLLSPGPVADAPTHAIMLRIARALSGPPRCVSMLLVAEGEPAVGADTQDIPTKIVPVPPPAAFEGGAAVRRSLGVLAELRRQAPDLIVVPEAGGLGFYAALLRHLGLGFEATRIVVLCLGPRAMRAALDGRLPAGRDDLALDHLERGSVAWADCAVSFCGTTLGWMERAGWTLPPQRRILPPPPPIRAAVPRAPGQEPGPGNEILFVGGLRRGDGLALFVDALRRIPRARLDGRTVTLLGCRGREAWSWDPEPWLATAMPAGLSWRVEAPPEPDAPVARLPRDGAVVVILRPWDRFPRVPGHAWRMARPSSDSTCRVSPRCGQPTGKPAWHRRIRADSRRPSTRRCRVASLRSRGFPRPTRRPPPGRA